MDFDEIGPRPRSEMLPKSDSAANLRRWFKSCPKPDARIAAICAHDPSAWHIFPGYLHTRAADAGNWLTPARDDPNFRGPNGQQVMQVGAAD